MKNIYDLVKETQDAYGLSGDTWRTVNQLRVAGFPSEVSGALVSSAVDFILNNDSKESVGSAYAFFKGGPSAKTMLCPVDGKNQMETILLVQNREALYCKACHVTLPVKVG